MFFVVREDFTLYHFLIVSIVLLVILFLFKAYKNRFKMLRIIEKYLMVYLLPYYTIIVKVNLLIKHFGLPC